jgi:hypothetical protein
MGILNLNNPRQEISSYFIILPTLHVTIVKAREAKSEKIKTVGI